MHFPPTQSSSYIVGAQREHRVKRAVLVGDVQLPREFARLDPTRLPGVPMKARRVCACSTTMQKQSFGTVTIAPARSTTLRTGVHLLPMIIGLVTTAPSQWKKFSTSGPLTPGKRYLLPPEKPTTSCGNTGPMMMSWS